jgi:hypothetical protein
MEETPKRSTSVSGAGDHIDVINLGGIIYRRAGVGTKVSELLDFSPLLSQRGRDVLEVLLGTLDCGMPRVPARAVVKSWAPDDVKENDLATSCG